MTPSQRPPLPCALSRRAWLASSLASGVAPVWAQAPAVAPPAELATDLPGARLRGRALMRFFGLHIYEIRLWTTAAAAAAVADPPQPPQPPLALELIYGRRLVGTQIASRSLDEMRQVGSPSEAQAGRWLAAMGQLFPDVRADDRLTGVMRSDGVARFHFNGQLRGEIAEADFSRLFFGIWLSPRTSEPGMREQLLVLAR